MSCFPFRSLWSCCCDRRTILEETESPPRTRSRSRKPKSLKHHRNTRVRIARDTGASSVSARRSATSTHRRHSYNPEKHSRSHSVGGTDADGRVRSSHSHSHRRSRSGTDASQSETRARRRRSGSGVDGRVAAERALSGDRSGMSRADSGHRRAKVSAANSSLGYGEGHLGGGGGSGEKRHSGRRGSHDDSGYRTEERRGSSRRAALANRHDADVARAATDGQYHPRPANGTLAPSEQDARAGILKSGSTGVHDSIVDMLRDHDRKATRAEAERPKSSRYRAKAGDAAAAGYANGNGNNPRAGIVNMLDHSAADSDEPAVRRRVSKKDAAYQRSKDDVSGIRKNIVNMLSHDSRDVERKHESSHAAGTSAHTRRHRSRSDAAGARKGIVNMHAHDDSDGDARASKLSRSKSTGHRSSSHRTAATIAAEATQTNTNGDVLRRKSTRGKRIREEDVDPNWRNPDGSDSEEEAAAARTSGGGHANGMQKRRTEKKAKESRSGSGSNSRSNRDASQPEGSSEAQKRRSGSSKTSTNKASTAAEASGSAAARITTVATARADYGPGREVAYVADPQPQTTAYMPDDIARIGREALRRPQLRSRGAYATGAQATAAQIAPPTYTYREDGPLLQTEAEHYEALTSHITSQQLEPLFPPENPHPKTIASRAATQSRRVFGVCEELELSKWANVDLAQIGLYDVIVFCDDSGSMMQQQRYETLKAVVRRITRIAAAYNTDGIQIRFINSTLDSGFNGIVTEAQVDTCLDRVVPNNGTALGTKLITKVVQPLILNPARDGKLRRPVIVSIVTDGQPEGESEDMLKHAIVATKTEMEKFSPPGGGRYGPSAVVFQLAQVGDSPVARRYVRALKEDPQIAGMIYCTHESLDDAMGNSQTRGQLNTWLTQLLAGTTRL